MIGWAARLMDAGAQVFEDISWFGVGGPKMDACGLEKLADMEVLSIIGFGDCLAPSKSPDTPS